MSPWAWILGPVLLLLLELFHQWYQPRRRKYGDMVRDKLGTYRYGGRAPPDPLPPPNVENWTE